MLHRFQKIWRNLICFFLIFPFLCKIRKWLKFKISIVLFSLSIMIPLWLFLFVFSVVVHWTSHWLQSVKICLQYRSLVDPGLEDALEKGNGHHKVFFVLRILETEGATVDYHKRIGRLVTISSLAQCLEDKVNIDDESFEYEKFHTKVYFHLQKFW